MRHDALGLFWEDLPSATRGGKRHDRPMPEVPPDANWKPPQHFPNLDSAICLAIDTETFDPELTTHGPGWGRNKGHVVGVSIGAVNAAGVRGNWYFPVRHEAEPQDNWEPAKVFEWLNRVLSNPRQPKIGANLQYDIGWLKHEGVEVKGELVDVQFAEALLEESAQLSLEAMGQKYLDEGKESNLLYEWLAEWKGGQPNGTQRKWLYAAPPRMVGPYAESDADLPLRLAQVLYPLLVKEGLLELFQLECRLIRLLVDMRMAGVRVDVDKAEQVRDSLIIKADDAKAQLRSMVGFDVNVNSSDSLARAFDSFGLEYGHTASGSPSFTKAFLAGVDHPIANIVKDIRKFDKLRGTFIESYILDSHVDGMLYGSFHQLRSEGGGTRSGRFSSSAPNLQNIPSRDDELAPLIRGMFVPDKGHVAWRKYDYSQIEYRMLIHFAVGAAGDEIRAYFKANPDTDYHVYAQNVVKSATGIDIPRKAIKNINFGLIYGMGVATLANSLGMSKVDAQAMMEAYFKGVPFAKPTMDSASKEAQLTGVINTVLNRKSRFDMWAPSDFRDQRMPLPYSQAIRSYGPDISRSYTHKALNRRLQGSAADLMKLAMVRCYEEGIFADTGIPRLTVHDELDFSDPGGCDKAFIEMRKMMEDAMPLDVPVKADGEIGPDWGHVKDIVE